MIAAPPESGAAPAVFGWVALSIAADLGIQWAMSEGDAQAVGEIVAQADPALAGCLTSTGSGAYALIPLTPNARGYYLGQVENYRTRAKKKLAGQPLALASVKKTIDAVKQKIEDEDAGLCGAAVGLAIIDRQIDAMKKTAPPYIPATVGPAAIPWGLVILAAGGAAAAWYAWRVS